MAELTHNKNVVRKKATSSLGAAAVVLNDPLLNQLVDGLLSSIQSQSDQTNVRTLIQTVGE